VNVQTAFENQKEVIRVVVRMSDKLAFGLDDHEVIAVELSDHPRLPVFRECRQLGCEICGLHKNFPFST
jgi:hypothetical protein